MNAKNNLFFVLINIDIKPVTHNARPNANNKIIKIDELLFIKINSILNGSEKIKKDAQTNEQIKPETIIKNVLISLNNLITINTFL